MFASHFPYRKINWQRKPINNSSYIEHNYSFWGKSGKRYLVIVEEYQYWMYMVKFCLQEHKIYNDKFNRLTGNKECSRIVATVGLIMKEIYNNNAYASFGFLGSNLPGEEKSNTKRFSLYAKVVELFISPVNFEHYTIPKYSAYLMINKDNNEPDLLIKIQQMFHNLYDFNLSE